MNSYNNLIDKIVTKENMLLAYERTARSKRKTFGYLEFKEYKQLNLDALADEMRSGEYKIGNYRQFIIYEPKPRLISALDFKDRLAQHALISIIEPIFEATFLPNTFACRAGLGTHAGVKYIQSELRKSDMPLYYLKTDFSKFFPSVNHNILLEMIHKKIACKLTLKIIEEIVKPNEVGIPIGSVTSQLFANVYGSLLDMYIHHDLGHRKWARYMDDVVILSNDIEKLKDDFYKIAEFSGKNMGMRISKWHCGNVNQGINFLGYRIWESHKLIRKDSVTRAKRKIAKYVKYGDNLNLDKFLASWRGHAGWSNSHNLFMWLERKHENNYQY
jgi:retron-type reverse transcriptase